LPSRLCDVPGFTPEHVAHALTAAKNPQLKMKLENMPVPLTSEQVDEYMGRVLEAASTGNLGLIRELRPYTLSEAR
jgi:alcohol dehydrogenase